ncbi:hypothetical protein [Nonlabens sp. SY33080]|uniref:hypothetical protein n=1 Tax=Nonlabens sp. SY33080 TaxID=2719911 RepID=UPI00142896CC|nr:hypothetical protein [Nonlabens sp. SY33080]
MDNTNKLEILNKYIEAWNVSSDGERQELLDSSFSANGRYIDPHIPAPVASLEEMKEIIITFRSRLPHHLKMVDEPEFHNYAFRMKWKMEHEGQVLSTGIFVGEYDSQNKINNVICFIDK